MAGCNNPSPSFTAQYFLRQILCLLQSIFVPSGSRSPSRTRTVSVTSDFEPLPAELGNFVSIFNYTGADLTIRKADNTDGSAQITIPDKAWVGLSIAQYTSEIEITADSGAAGVQYVID